MLVLLLFCVLTLSDIKKFLEKLDRIPISFLVVILFFSMFFLLKYQFGPYIYDYNNSIHLSGDDIRCIDRLERGILYEDDPECHQGPFFYIVTYALREASSHNFAFFIVIFSLVLFCLIFFLFYKIIKEEVGELYFLGLILYLIFVFIYGLVEFDFSVLLEFSGFFIGFYTLFYSNIKFKEFFSGCFFAFSILSKPTAIIPVIFSLIFYFYNILKISIKNSKLIIERDKIYKFLFILMPLIIISVIFHLIFPNFFIYTISIANQSYASEDLDINILSSKFFVIPLKIFSILRLQPDLTNLFLVSIFVLTLFLFIKERKFIETYTLFSIVFIMILWFSLGNNILEYKRFLLILPLFIISLLKLVKMSKSNIIGRGLIILMILILIYPAFNILYIGHQFSELEKDVNYVLEKFPEQDYILADKDRLKFYNYKSNYKIDIISEDMFGKYDADVSNALEKAGLINMSLWDYKEIIKQRSFFLNITKLIAEGKYDTIMYLPQGKGRTINRLILFMRDLSKMNSFSFNEIFPMKCYVYIPTIEEKCVSCAHEIIVYFSENSQCDLMKEIIADYYTEHFDRICEKDENAARFIRNIFYSNGESFDKECKSGGHLLTDYKNSYNIETKKIAIIIIFFLVFFITYLLLKIEKRKIFYQQLKDGCIKNKLFLIIIIIIILISITFISYIPFKFPILCNDHFIKVEEKNECCLDDNDDVICDENKEDSIVKECIIKQPYGRIAIGRVCKSNEECIEKARKMKIVEEEYLNDEFIICEETVFTTLPELIECNDEQDCLDSIGNLTYSNEIIKCSDFGFCQMTAGSIISLKKIYFIK